MNTFNFFLSFFINYKNILLVIDYFLSVSTMKHAKTIFLTNHSLIVTAHENISCPVVSNSLQPSGMQPGRLHCPWNFSGKNTAVSCHFLLWEFFLIQGSNLSLLHFRQILYHLSHQGSPDRTWGSWNCRFIFRISYGPRQILKTESTDNIVINYSNQNLFLC